MNKIYQLWQLVLECNLGVNAAIPHYSLAVRWKKYQNKYSFLKFTLWFRYISSGFGAYTIIIPMIKPKIFDSPRLDIFNMRCLTKNRLFCNLQASY